MKKRATRLTRTAYHEAGHAVMCWWLRKHIKGISIIPEGDSLGRIVHGKPMLKDIEGFNTFWDTHSRKHFEIERQIMVSFAGCAAESLLTGRNTRAGSEGDYRQTAGFLFNLTGNDSELATAWGNYLYTKAKSILSMPVCWQAVEALAGELLVRKHIGGRKARQIIQDAMRALPSDKKEET